MMILPSKSYTFYVVEHLKACVEYHCTAIDQALEEDTAIFMLLVKHLTV